MLETIIFSVTAFIVTIGPIDVSLVFLALTAKLDKQKRKSIAIRGTVIAAAILIFFAIFGEFILDGFGISLAALRTAGGTILFLLGLDMIFARSTGGTSTSHDERIEAETHDDLAYFTLQHH